jgi:hypothetical protein
MELLGDKAQVLILTQDRCTVCAKCTTGSGIILDETDVTPLVMNLKWMLVSVCLEIVLILTQDSCMVCAERTIGLEKSLWTHPMELLGDVAHEKSYFGPFKDGVSVGAR